MSHPDETPADRHRRVAATFGDVAGRGRDWDAPTPVPGWVARDVVVHLVTWSRAFLAAGGIRLPERTDVVTDPAEAWLAHAADVQRLLDAPSATEAFTHPHLGTAPLGETLDRVYTTDVLMHTWDLARAAGVPSGLEADECARLLEEIRPIEELLRSSGQFGPAVDAAPGTDPVTRLMAFVGRDPGWAVPTS